MAGSNGKYYKDESLGTIWIGEVVNTADPLQLGRVKIKIFSKYDELEPDVIPWAIPYNQLSTGTSIIPKVGDIVNAFFENGDEYVPFYFTSIKNSDDLLAEYGDDYPKIWSLVYDKRMGEDGEGTLGEERTLEVFYTETQGLIIRKNQSFIQIKNEDESILLSNGSTQKVIHISDDGISIGTEGTSAEPAVLGDTLEELLNSFITELGKISAIATPAGPSGPISGAPTWAPLVQKFKTDFVKFKSKLVTLDAE